MTGQRNETRTTGLNYPMVELLTGAIMQLMYLNTLAVCCLLPLVRASMKNLTLRQFLKGLPKEGRMCGE